MHYSLQHTLSSLATALKGHLHILLYMGVAAIHLEVWFVYINQITMTNYKYKVCYLQIYVGTMSICL